jgi:hypothetical protein
MIKSRTANSFAALAIFALLGAAVIALPGFAPPVKASEVTAMTKADRLDTRTVAGNCAQQVWPDFDRSCLREGQSGDPVREARLVTARR